VQSDFAHNWAKELRVQNQYSVILPSEQILDVEMIWDHALVYLQSDRCVAEECGFNEPTWVELKYVTEGNRFVMTVLTDADKVSGCSNKHPSLLEFEVEDDKNAVEPYVPDDDCVVLEHPPDGYGPLLIELQDADYDNEDSSGDYENQRGDGDAGTQGGVQMTEMEDADYNNENEDEELVDYYAFAEDHDQGAANDADVDGQGDGNDVENVLGNHRDDGGNEECGGHYVTCEDDGGNYADGGKYAGGDEDSDQEYLPGEDEEDWLHRELQPDEWDIYNWERKVSAAFANTKKPQALVSEPNFILYLITPNVLMNLYILEYNIRLTTPRLNFTMQFQKLVH
jgi:hypothetical protein